MAVPPEIAKLQAEMQKDIEGFKAAQAGVTFRCPFSPG